MKISDTKPQTKPGVPRMALWIAVGIGCWLLVGVGIGVLAIRGWVPRRTNEGVFLTTKQFGLIQADGSIAASTRIPRQAGTSYGWSLYVFPAGNFTRIQEVFVLPEGGRFGPPSKPKSKELKVVERSVSEDGRVKTEVYEVEGCGG